jgi:hypothetical protein
MGGAVVHGVGMTLKYRLESREDPPLWWESALFWLCWACLAALGLWLVVVVAIARKHSVLLTPAGLSLPRPLAARPPQAFLE